MNENKLKIEADALDLELTGDADYVIQAYEAIRSVAMERFEQTLSDSPAQPSNTPRPSPSRDDKKIDKKTDPHFSVDGLTQQVAAAKELVGLRLQLVVCTEMYYRVAALARDDFRESIFGSILDPDALAKVYLQEAAADRLEDQIEFNKTLWRKLTKAGKAAINGDSS